MIHGFTDNSVAYHTAGKFGGGKLGKFGKLFDDSPN